MKVRVDVDTDCCDDCPFLTYTSHEYLCVLSDGAVDFPFGFFGILSNCPLKHSERIKYSNIGIIKESK